MDHEYTGPKVFGAGLPRTGTSSLQDALRILGLKRCYHFDEVMKESFPYTEARMWQKALKLPGEKNKPMRQQILREIFQAGKYQAAVDYPAACFVKDFVEMYPEAKFVQSVRASPEAWKRSIDSATGPVVKFVFPYVAMWSPRQLFMLRGLLQGLAAWRKALHGNSGLDKDDLRHYAVYNAYVKDVVPPERLLADFQPARGWEPLCTFLGLELPQDEAGVAISYPHLNDTAEMKARKAQWIREGLFYWAVVLGIGAVGLKISLKMWRPCAVVLSRHLSIF